jgi:hypothetical protein
MAIVARRGAGAVFAATWYVIDPAPCPLLADVMVTQAALVDADHVQSRGTPIVSVSEPPAAGAVAAGLPRLMGQRTGDGAVVDCSDEVQERPPATVASAINATVPDVRPRIDLVRFEQSTLLLMRNPAGRHVCNSSTCTESPPQGCFSTSFTHRASRMALDWPKLERTWRVTAVLSCV